MAYNTDVFIVPGTGLVGNRGSVVVSAPKGAKNQFNNCMYIPGNIVGLSGAPNQVDAALVQPTGASLYNWLSGKYPADGNTIVATYPITGYWIR